MHEFISLWQKEIGFIEASLEKLRLSQDVQHK